MNEKIIRDIRYFELKPDNYTGPFDGILGNIYVESPDTKFIGQRIARKLNEFRFVSGEFDHIYINLSNKLPENDIYESDFFLDKQIKHFDYGVKPSDFNKLTDNEKNLKIKEITFNTLYRIYKNHSSKTQVINQTKSLIDNHGKKLIIRFKTKETTQYRIDLSYQIRPYNDKSKSIIEFTDKKDNNITKGTLDILDYQDLYLLIDKLSLKNGVIIFHPKKSYNAELAARKYKKPPIGFEISRLTEK